MNVVDAFSVNGLLNSDYEPLRRIGSILYRCDGTLDENGVNEIAELLKEHIDELEQEGEWQ